MAHLTYIARSRSRSLCKAETPAEAKLWEALRSRRLNGHKFVRQLSIGPYFADFACRTAKLIVEVDGATHGDAAEVSYDERRSAFLVSQGWIVLRVWNNDIYNNLDGACDTILMSLNQPQ